MPDKPLNALEPWQEAYWALTDPHGKVLVRLDTSGRRLAIKSKDPKSRDSKSKDASKDPKLEAEVAFLNRHLDHPAWQGATIDVFLAAYSRSEENVQSPIQVRPMFR